MVCISKTKEGPHFLLLFTSFDLNQGGSHADPPLMGTDAKDKAIVEIREKRANEEGMLTASELFRNTHPAFADRGLPGSAEAVQ